MHLFYMMLLHIFQALFKSSVLDWRVLPAFPPFRWRLPPSPRHPPQMKSAHAPFFVLNCLTRFEILADRSHPPIAGTMFPGIGLGAVLSRCKLITPSMLVAAVKALAAQAPALKDPDAALLPDVTDVREISVQIAASVIKQAVQEDLAQEHDIPTDDKELEEWIREQMWNAEYRPLRKVSKEAADRVAMGEAGSKGVSTRS